VTGRKAKNGGEPVPPFRRVPPDNNLGASEALKLLKPTGIPPPAALIALLPIGWPACENDMMFDFWDETRVLTRAKGSYNGGAENTDSPSS